jgi:DeoR family transcriptional regulator of aga operon
MASSIKLSHMTSSPKLIPVSLLPSQRRDRIVDFLRRHGAVTLQQLAQAMDASVSTLRRDLDGLEADGVLDRTHGGALLRQQHYSTFEPNPAAAAELSPKEKRAIGYAAAADLQPGQSVIFDSGSTVMEAARAALERRIELTAVTNDLAIAQLLGSSPLVRVHVLGGTLRRDSNTLMGDEVQSGARHIRADVLLMGAHAVTDGVLSETDPEVAAVKRALMQAATSRRLLVDASKFRPRAFMTVCGLNELHALITDTGAPAADIEAIIAGGLRVTQVSVA